MSRTIRIIAALAPFIVACSDKPAEGPIPGGPYVDVTFEMSESALTASHPEVVCKQMRNPAIRMCQGKGSAGRDVSFLFYSGKLINIDGHTQD